MTLSSIIESTGRAGKPIQGMRVVPLGGLGEIGMNCLVLEWEDELIIVDCGLLFSDLDHFGVGFVIPDFQYLRERADKVAAILLTHGHEDHIGAVPFLLKAGIHAPIYCSNFTSMLLRHRLTEHGLVQRADVRVFKPGERFAFKRFGFEAVSVNHSIVDAMALFIETPFGRVIHTGDFKIDPQPFYGEQLDIERFRRAGDEGVLLLLSDSTNVERHSHSLSESRIYQKFEQFLAAAEGLTLIAMFASNVGRMGQVIDLARKMNKKVALSGRGMEQNVKLAMEAGYLDGAAGVLITLDQLDAFDRRDVIVMSTGSQAEPGSSLMRVAYGEHRGLKLGQGDQVLMSSRYIPGNEKAIGRMINHLFRQGAEVVYEAVHEIHASGHATRPELKLMLELVRPRFFMPVHGEYRHLVHHAELAVEAGVRSENVKLAVDGDVLEIEPGRFEIIDRLEETRVLVEGREGNDVTRLVLKERKALGEMGVVFALLVRNSESRRIVSGPEVITKGLASESMEGFLVEEARNVARKVVEDYERSLTERGPAFDLQEEVRLGLRRFFNGNLGKKPTVIPIIIDV